MFVVLAFVDVQPERVVEFEALAAQLWSASHTLEPGLRRYEYARREAPGAYLVAMTFDDYEAFITHQASDHHVELAGAMREMFVRLEIEYAQPVTGAFGVPASDTGERAELGELSVPPARRPDYEARYPRPDVAWWRPGVGP